MLKNLVLVALASIIWASGVPVGLSDIGILFTVMPIVGLVGCLGAMILCFTRKMFMIALVLGILGLAGSAMFGIMVFIGPVGLVLALLGVVLLALSKKEFTS
jgi:hypothetical protein